SIARLALLLESVRDGLLTGIWHIGSWAKSRAALHVSRSGIVSHDDANHVTAPGCRLSQRSDKDRQSDTNHRHRISYWSSCGAPFGFRAVMDLPDDAHPSPRFPLERAPDSDWRELPAGCAAAFGNRAPGCSTPPDCPGQIVIGRPASEYVGAMLRRVVREAEVEMGGGLSKLQTGEHERREPERLVLTSFLQACKTERKDAASVFASLSRSLETAGNTCGATY
ncbi:hypothetical protein L226DRAFT_527761, partial [Lentinus tigrinus ALCF2SS1-7]